MLSGMNPPRQYGDDEWYDTQWESAEYEASKGKKGKWKGSKPKGKSKGKNAPRSITPDPNGTQPKANSEARSFVTR